MDYCCCYLFSCSKVSIIPSSCLARMKSFSCTSGVKLSSSPMTMTISASDASKPLPRISSLGDLWYSTCFDFSTVISALNDEMHRKQSKTTDSQKQSSLILML